MISGDEDVREGLVIAHQDVVAGPQPLDHVAFEQQRLNFGMGRHDFKRGGFADHPEDPERDLAGTGVACDPFPQIPCFSDVEDITGGIEHPVHAGAHRQGRQLRLDDCDSSGDIGPGFGFRPVRGGGVHCRNVVTGGFPVNRSGGLISGARFRIGREAHRRPAAVRALSSRPSLAGRAVFRSLTRAHAASVFASAVRSGQ